MKIKLNFLKFFFIFFFSIIIFININKKRIKVCICAIGKLENKYIREFVSHYKKYGVDKIFLYDNNDLNGERFEDIINDEIKNNFVIIFNIRGKTPKQLKINEHCYKANYKNYDWIIFFDIDEYIYLKNYNNIKDYLIQKKFNKCPSIYLNWIKHTDNNLLYYDNRTLHERFPETYKSKNECLGKTIIRGNLESFHCQSTHSLDRNIETCNSFGHKFKIRRKRFCIIPDMKYYYIEHYEYKSTEEFISKINKGDCVFGNSTDRKLERIRRYFRYNKITLEKINLIEKKMGLNISKYKKYLKKNKNI